MNTDNKLIICFCLSVFGVLFCLIGALALPQNITANIISLSGGLLFLSSVITTIKIVHSDEESKEAKT
jgi:hypothetical protein